MNDESAEARPVEAPESPKVVKNAQDTLAKPKVKAKAAAPARAETAPETPRENAPESGRETAPETPGKVDNALSIFGWDL